MSVKLGPGLSRTTKESWEREARYRFVRARRAIGTQEQVALLLGVSATSVQNWERGAAKVPAWALCVVEGRRAA